MLYIHKQRLQEDYTYETFSLRETTDVKDIVDDFNSLDLEGEILLVADDTNRIALYLGEERIAYSNGDWVGEMSLKDVENLYDFLKTVLENPKIGELQAIEILFNNKAWVFMPLKNKKGNFKLWK